VITGGIERVPLLQTLYLRRQGIEADCYATSIDEETCFPDLVRRVAPRPILPWTKKAILGIRALNHLGGVALCRLWPRVLSKYDILQAHYQPAPWLCYFAHRRYGTPYTIYAHGICKELYPRSIDLEAVPEKKMTRSILRKFRLWSELDHESFSNAAVCFANSRYIEKQLSNLYGIANLVVLYPGVDTDRFRPMSSEETEFVLPKHGIRTPFIFTSNQHIGYKKIEWLIEMMPLILKEAPELSLVVAGNPNPDYTPKLLRAAKKLSLRNKVLFLGRVDEYDLAALYNRATVYAFSPPDEDFGMGPVEAMCCGTPPVAWDAGGPRETIVDGESGLLAKPYEFHDFASKCLRIATDVGLREKLAMNALAARARFSWETHTSQLLQVLFRLIGAANP